MEQLVITGIILLLIVILEIFLYCKLIKVSKMEVSRDPT